MQPLTLTPEASLPPTPAPIPIHRPAAHVRVLAPADKQAIHPRYGYPP